MATSDWTARLSSDRWRGDRSGAENVNGFAGRAVCEDLGAALAAAAPQAQIGAPVAEDYGWGFWARLAGEPIWIAVSFVTDDEEAPGPGPQEYVVSVAPPKTSWLPWKKPAPAAASDFATVIAAFESWFAAQGVAHRREG